MFHLLLPEATPVPMTMRRASTEVTIPSEYFQGSPWDGCEDLAEEDLQDFVSYSQSSPWGFEDITSRIFSIASSPMASQDNIQASPFGAATWQSLPVGTAVQSGGAAQGLLMAFEGSKIEASISCEEDLKCGADARDSMDSASTACPSAAGSSLSLASSARPSMEPPPSQRLGSPERLGIMSSIFAAKAAAERDTRERLPSGERCGIMSSVFAAKAAERDAL